MKKVFLDIGAYIGDTAKVVIKYNFDEIHCFEPVKENCDIMKRMLLDNRLVFHKHGLWNKTCTKPMYNPGSIGSSIFKDKKNISNNYKECDFVKSSIWFEKNITYNDYVIVKINVEGAEIAILNDLIDSGEYKKINHILISFDTHKIPGKEHEKELMISKFYKHNIFNYFISGQIKYLTRRLLIDKKNKYSDHEKIIRQWFKIIEEEGLLCG